MKERTYEYGTMKKIIRFLPWRFLSWIDRRFPTCWTSLVMLKQRGPDEDTDSWSVRPTSSCWDGLKGKEYDYCGKYQTHEAFCRARGDGRELAEVRGTVK